MEYFHSAMCSYLRNEMKNPEDWILWHYLNAWRENSILFSCMKNHLMWCLRNAECANSRTNDFGLQSVFFLSHSACATKFLVTNKIPTNVLLTQPPTFFPCHLLIWVELFWLNMDGDRKCLGSFSFIHQSEEAAF